MGSTTVRDAALDVLRELELTTIFSNPGSTEIDLLGSLPDDFRFVLGLHEATVVGMASGYALGRGAPALAIVHTTAGLGNAVSALANARANRTPVVVVVGQQDRRHSAFEPFLTGRLARLAGDEPVWVGEPACAAAVPGAVARAYHEAEAGLGPALVIVPMDDWSALAAESGDRAAPAQVRRAELADPDAVGELAALVDAAAAPALVVGAGITDERSWAAVVALAERLGCPVWQEAFSGGAGFPQDHPQFAGHLPAGRGALRETLRGRDAVLVVGGAALKQYLYEPGPLVDPGTRVAVLTVNPPEAHRSAAELVVLAPIAHACELLAGAVTKRPAEPIAAWRRPTPPSGGPLRAGHVLDGLAQRLSADTIVIEEAPSSRPELIDRIVVREPRRFISTAMGGLGFAIPAAVGLRMAQPRQPVVAIVGDGSALYCIQALWSASHYGVGAVFVVLSNGGYEVMDRLAQASELDAPWPGFGSLDVGRIASGFGCETVSVTTHEELTTTLDDVLASLPERTSPLLIDVSVVRDEA